MRNRGIRRRRAKRNYVDFSDFEIERPEMEHPLGVLHEIRSHARSSLPGPDHGSSVSSGSANPSATG
jgi:hypothetical protein